MRRDWLQEIESNLFSPLPYMVGSTPQSEAEKSHFEEFKSKVEQLKDSKNGRVPIVVYRILAVL